MIVAPGVLGPQLCITLTPGIDRQRLLQRWQHHIQIARQTNVYLAQFVQLSRVDIHMDNFGIRGKGIQLTGYTIVKTRANRDKQIAFLYRQVSRFGAMHPQHAQIVRIIRIHHSESFQGGSRWHLRYSKKLAQRRYRLCHPHAAANV